MPPSIAMTAAAVAVKEEEARPPLGGFGLALAAVAGRGVPVRGVEFVTRVARSLPRSRLLLPDDPSLLAPLSLELRLPVPPLPRWCRRGLALRLLRSSERDRFRRPSCGRWLSFRGGRRGVWCRLVRSTFAGRLLLLPLDFESRPRPFLREPAVPSVKTTGG